MIDLKAAEQLLDFGARIGPGARAQEQLEGAVALHNILETHRVAYLADEVGMGKTYVALGALALFRHYNPDFRVLVIAPQENIQNKWMKELSNFVAHNMRFSDLRVCSIDGRPARPLTACGNLIEFAREVVRDSRRDFFLRLTSFSLPLGRDSDGWRRLRDDLRRSLPWMPDEVFDLRNKNAFKENFARAVCCAMPVFDLVIFDEGHNIKHGYTAGASARNRVLALAFGHPSDREGKRIFKDYGPRASRVLFLSATPVEESYRHIWNQLDVFGFGEPFRDLCRDDLTEDVKKEIVGQFLIRRVTTLRAGSCELTKNQYRREWRAGGVVTHDEPIKVEDDRQRLVVALVQKKVAELLGSEKFNRSFQIGMLASFESFLETTRLKRSDPEEVQTNFDEADQTDDPNEREGIDVRDVNRLSDSYRKTFGHEMPHPKMDAVVDSLSDAWRRGEKSLIFVRRVASVKELKRKLDERYDAWLIPSLRERLPEGAREKLGKVIDQYKAEKLEADKARQVRITASMASDLNTADEVADDRGGTDSFFAWFFRGDGPRGVVSGANIQRRFIQRGTVYATFFEDNHVADLLDVSPGDVLPALARAMNMEPDAVRNEIQRRAARFLSRAKKHPSADRLEAAQAAAVEMLKELPDTSILGRQARIVWSERYANSLRKPHTSQAPDVCDRLEQATFFTELQRPERRDLREALWPEPKEKSDHDGFRKYFRERELRAQLLATAARLGHALIDLYVLTIQRIGSLDLRTQEDSGEDDTDFDRRRIDEYLDMLDAQRNRDRSISDWTAYDELADIARNYELILDVNAPDARTKPLAETARYFGSILRQQQPVGGMSGQVNKTLVLQFRMPGYPLVLVTTDLLKEGEDLHTFCSAVHHYGISWTSSSMEQRIGRIDRVRSHTDRRLGALSCEPRGEQLLQVYFPYLEDSVEILQVQKVLERMNVFLRLMHEGLAAPKDGPKRVDVGKEIIGGRRIVEVIRERLRSAFPVQEWALQGHITNLGVTDRAAQEALDRLHALTRADYGNLQVKWEQPNGNGILLGTVVLPSGRIQPFALLLALEKDYLVFRCISPVGRVQPQNVKEAIAESIAKRSVRLGVILSRDEHSYDLTVEEDVLVGNREFDALRAGMLLTRVAEHADALEQIHLPGRDQPLDEFEDDLKEEGRNGF